MVVSPMHNFFESRSKRQMAGDLVIGTIGQTVHGVYGSLLLGVTGSSILAAGSLSLVASACAIGGAVVIIPAVLLRQMTYGKNTNLHFLLKLAADVTLSAAIAFAAGCIGAATLGLAMTPVGLAALSGALVFQLFNTLTKLVTSQEKETVYFSNQRFIKAMHEFILGNILLIAAGVVLPAPAAIIVPYVMICGFYAAFCDAPAKRLNKKLFGDKLNLPLYFKIPRDILYPALVAFTVGCMAGIAGGLSLATGHLTFMLLNKLNTMIVKCANADQQSVPFSYTDNSDTIRAYRAARIAKIDSNLAAPTLAF